MYTTEHRPISREVRFASIVDDRPKTPTPGDYLNFEEDVKSSTEVDLSSLLSQAQKYNDQEKSSLNTDSDSVYNENRYRKKWELDVAVPATAFGGIIRFDDDTVDYRSTITKRRSSPLSLGLGMDGATQPPKTAPLPPSRNTLNFQPFDEPLTPQHGQTSILQPPPTSTNHGGVYLHPPPTATAAKIDKLSLDPVDNVQKVKNHLEGLSIHLSGLFDQVNQIEELKKEVKYWKDVCLGLEIGKKDLEVVLTQTQNQQVESKFTAVLIDGDNYIVSDELEALAIIEQPNYALSYMGQFQEKYLQAGYEGGQEAAQVLLRTIKERNSSEKVMMQVFLNKSTLGATLIKNGIIQTWAKYDRFWQGFSSISGLIAGEVSPAIQGKQIAEGYVLVCDLGSGGETAQNKIDEYSRLYIDSPQCDQIVVGTSPKTCPRSSNTYQGYASEKVSVLSLDAPLHPSEHRMIDTQRLFQTTELVPLTAKPDHAHTHLLEHIEEYHWSSFDPSESRSGRPGKIHVPPVPALSSDEFSPKRKFKKTNKYNKAAAEQVRRLDPRPCHTHYLSEWGCRDVDACSYGHGYHLSNAQLNELARMAKSVICPYMKDGRCRYDDEDCVYG
ncbi:hypothetical protein L486_02273 [Kwoniella mangroviensis CBS 10435]|uniref:DUF7923 domain-containing protein n=1 Tax=Kwoniella mangroviensis CBS 10435 TaxID=1331196 RepID=A0A1B9IVN7_9TREE|nr:hypothetical protein L486_02273 [Kwoniella mangroviensis CBS 10435]